MMPVAALPVARPRTRTPYENWRPPIIGVSVLALVGATSLVLPCLPGGAWALPTGTVENGQSPEEAAQTVLTCLSGELPVQRRVVVDQVQMRRRKIITHLVITAPLTTREAYALAYRDPRAQVRVVRTAQGLASLPEKARLRALLGLQTFAIGATVYLRNGEVQRLESAPRP
ncbi:hypothetical protein [Streptomyces sp. NPDC088400]|jgi:ADP-ribose pyrophosphatase YjhB (NUDIX family)|uniref:hypothetical protein n=1 Tax=Streptomyces sp. NPDC088400 TaxID=3365861 RepID=UPI00381B4EA7